MWPIPRRAIANSVVGHSKGDPRGEVTKSAAETAFTACLKNNWVQIVDKQFIRKVHAIVRNQRLIGPIYGYPKVLDIDFTAYGASLYGSVIRQLFGTQWGRSHAHVVELRNRSRHFFQTKYAARAAINSWKKERVVASIGKLTLIGPWCIYWWKHFQRGHYVDVEFGDNAKGLRFSR
jgi:hypothetical protein